MKKKPTFRLIELELPIKISDEQFLEKSHELVDRISHLTTMETQIAEVRDHYKESIKLEARTIQELSLTLKIGSSSGSVPCQEVFDWARKLILVRRIDTGEYLPGRAREMTDHEESAQTDCLEQSSTLPPDACPKPADISAAAESINLDKTSNTPNEKTQTTTPD